MFFIFQVKRFNEKPIDKMQGGGGYNDMAWKKKFQNLSNRRKK